ncbi:hypothetical protein O6H91_23G007600 [Diphasiastrum complanatum]|uniref:Uncharacterized protein n=1 Tax=Diphasiastrum complanatum TaxID=34168 RepID=A0ACC2A7V3_DIPCM|nr:hypothetical protein O6H91_23G007600 [Diphasiastrum complanatum]
MCFDTHSQLHVDIAPMLATDVADPVPRSSAFLLFLTCAPGVYFGITLAASSDGSSDSPSVFGVSYDGLFYLLRLFGYLGARELITRASSHLQHVQQRYQTSVDRHRRHVEFQLGDMVCLRLRFARHHFVQGHASTDKLAPRYYGPYRILEVLSPVTYRLQLTASTRACDVFHVSLLRAAIEDDAPCDAECPTAPELFPFLPVAILQVRLYHSRRRRQIQFWVQ